MVFTAYKGIHDLDLEEFCLLYHPFDLTMTETYSPSITY